MDPRDQLNVVIDAISKISLLAQLRAKVIEADQTDKRECGNCNHWMKRPDCPYEKGLGSGMGGPSCSHPPCGKFQMTQSTMNLKAKRIADAVDFAKRHDLPIPASI